MSRPQTCPTRLNPPPDPSVPGNPGPARLPEPRGQVCYFMVVMTPVPEHYPVQMALLQPANRTTPPSRVGHAAVVSELAQRAKASANAATASASALRATGTTPVIDA